MSTATHPHRGAGRRASSRRTARAAAPLLIARDSTTARYVATRGALITGARLLAVVVVLAIGLLAGTAAHTNGLRSDCDRAMRGTDASGVVAMCAHTFPDRY